MSSNGLDRRAVVADLLAGREDLLVVGGLGACAWDITAAGDRDLNFPLWGGMGQAAMIGLGLALAQPSRPVLVVTGDGEMLMGMGSLATVAIHAPGNLSIAVLDNARYGETGNQESHTAFGVDLTGVARSCGIKDCQTLDDHQDVRQWAAAQLNAQSSLCFARVIINDREEERVMPPRDAVHLKTRFRMALGLAS